MVYVTSVMYSVLGFLIITGKLNRYSSSYCWSPSRHSRPTTSVFGVLITPSSLLFPLRKFKTYIIK